MSWHSFHFCCRLFKQKITAGFSLKQAEQHLTQYYPEHDFSNYADNKQGVSLSQQALFKTIVAEKDEKKLVENLTVFAQLNLSWDTSGLNKFSEIKSYLLAVFAVFMILSLIYNIFVFPAFIDLFDPFDVEIASQFEYFSIIWGATTLAILSIGFVIYAFDRFVNKIKTQQNPEINSRFASWVLSAPIVTAVEKLMATMHAPLAKNINTFSLNEIKKVEQYKDDELEVATELQCAIDKRRTKLVNLINKRMTRLVVLISTLIALVIAYFVYSAYQPIFSIGSIL